MKTGLLILCVPCVLALAPPSAPAQRWSGEELGIWKIISNQWKLESADDEAWIEMLHPSFLGWAKRAPMPHDKKVTVRFITAEADQFKVVVEDIQPVGIVVTGDTAVAHYYHISIQENKNGEREISTGRYTDVLIRTGDGWRFLSWVGDERLQEGGS